MNTEIQPFEFEGNKVRALADGDEVVFVASDIAKILGYRDAANLARNLDDDERGIHEVSTPNGTQNMTVLTESGLYRSILNREIAYVKEPEAQAFVKRFQRWVTHEVLPQIRRTGGYIHTTNTDSDEDILAKAVLVAQKTIEHKNRQIAEKDAQIKVLEPKALFADAVAASDGTCLVGELAKMLRQSGMEIGQNRLFRILRDEGFLGKSGSNTNVPTQRAMELGLFEIKETVIQHADGHTSVSRTPRSPAGARPTSSTATRRKRRCDMTESSDFRIRNRQIEKEYHHRRLVLLCACSLVVGVGLTLALTWRPEWSEWLKLVVIVLLPLAGGVAGGMLSGDL